jgi:hypothetical protein
MKTLEPRTCGIAELAEDVHVSDVGHRHIPGRLQATELLRPTRQTVGREPADDHAFGWRVQLRRIQQIVAQALDYQRMVAIHVVQRDLIAFVIKRAIAA